MASSAPTYPTWEDTCSSGCSHFRMRELTPWPPGRGNHNGSTWGWFGGTERDNQGGLYKAQSQNEGKGKERQGTPDWLGTPLNVPHCLEGHSAAPSAPVCDCEHRVAVHACTRKGRPRFLLAVTYRWPREPPQGPSPGPGPVPWSPPAPRDSGTPGTHPGTWCLCKCVCRVPCVRSGAGPHVPSERQQATPSAVVSRGRDPVLLGP